jgi:hypothetical protein
MSRSQILHVRARLVEDGLIWYQADERVRGCGRIGWNLDIATWKPLQPDYRRWGGARPGAGRPRKSLTASRVVTLKNEDENAGQDEVSALSVPGGNSSLQHEKPAEKSRLQLAERAEKSRLQQPGNSRLQLGAGSQEFKMTTPASVEPTQEAVSSPVLRRKLRRTITETPIVVSEVQGTSQESLLDSTNSAEAQQTKVADPVGSSSPGTSHQPAYWPLRQPHERTDLDYYQRVLREREQERVALLTRLAHKRIGVALEKASYARIGALAKQCGAALLVKHILLAAANHIDGDPLDHLTKLARGQQRKETSHVTRPTTPTSSYQPYTAEEASQLVRNSFTCLWTIGIGNGCRCWPRRIVGRRRWRSGWTVG